MADIRTILREAAPTAPTLADVQGMTREAYSRRRHRRGLAVTTGLASIAVVSLGIMVVVDDHQPGPQGVAMQQPSESTPGASSPTTICPPYSAPGQQVICPAGTAEAERLLGSQVPQPVVPSGYVLVLSEIYTVDGHPTLDLFQRTWTPTGGFGTHGATGPFIELRVSRDQSHGGPPTVPAGEGGSSVTLDNGVNAYETAGPNPALLRWSHQGLEYALESSGVAVPALLRAANSLP